MLKGWQNSLGMGWQNSQVLKHAQYLNFNNYFLCDKDPSNIIKEEYMYTLIKLINTIPEFKFRKTP